MRKIVKRWGDSLIILLDAEDCKIYDLEVGDIVNIEFTKIQSPEDEQ